MKSICCFNPGYTCTSIPVQKFQIFLKNWPWWPCFLPNQEETRSKLHIMSWMILFKKQLFDLEVKGQGPTKVITVCDTPPYGHAAMLECSHMEVHLKASVFSTPDTKGHVSYCHHLVMSSIRPSVNFHILIFFFDTTEF
jgi:hypothetical protein